jgi:hypothetical protein
MAKFLPKLTRSARCHIRRAKAEIRRQDVSPEEEKRQIAEVYARFGVTR